MDDEDLMVGGEDLDYEEYDINEEEEKALLEAEEGIDEQLLEEQVEIEDGSESQVYHDEGFHGKSSYHKVHSQQYDGHADVDDYSHHNALNDEGEAVDVPKGRVHDRLLIPQSITTADCEVQEGEEEDEECDEDEEVGERDRFKSERSSTSLVSLRNSGTKRDIPDSLDNVVTPNVPEQPNRGKGRGNRNKRGRGGATLAARPMLMSPACQPNAAAMLRGSPLMNIRGMMTANMPPMPFSIGMPGGSPYPNYAALGLHFSTPSSVLRPGVAASPMRAISPLIRTGFNPRFNAAVSAAHLQAMRSGFNLQQVQLASSPSVVSTALRTSVLNVIRPTSPIVHAATPVRRPVSSALRVLTPTTTAYQATVSVNKTLTTSSGSASINKSQASDKGASNASKGPVVSRLKPPPCLTTSATSGTIVKLTAGVPKRLSSEGVPVQPVAKILKTEHQLGVASNAQKTIHSRLSNVAKPTAASTKTPESEDEVYQRKLEAQKKAREALLAKKKVKRQELLQQTATSAPVAATPAPSTVAPPATATGATVPKRPSIVRPVAAATSQIASTTGKVNATARLGVGSLSTTATQQRKISVVQRNNLPDSSLRSLPGAVTAARGGRGRILASRISQNRLQTGAQLQPSGGSLMRGAPHGRGRGFRVPGPPHSAPSPMQTSLGFPNKLGAPPHNSGLQPPIRGMGGRTSYPPPPHTNMRIPPPQQAPLFNDPVSAIPNLKVPPPNLAARPPPPAPSFSSPPPAPYSRPPPSILPPHHSMPPPTASLPPPPPQHQPSSMRGFDSTAYQDSAYSGSGYNNERYEDSSRRFIDAAPHQQAENGYSGYYQGENSYIADSSPVLYQPSVGGYQQHRDYEYPAEQRYNESYDAGRGETSFYDYSSCDQYQTPRSGDDSDLRKRLVSGSSRQMDEMVTQPIPTVSSFRDPSPAPHYSYDASYGGRAVIGQRNISEADSYASYEPVYPPQSYGTSSTGHTKQTAKKCYKRVTRKSRSGEVLFVKRIPIDEHGNQIGEAVVEYEKPKDKPVESRQVVAQYYEDEAQAPAQQHTRTVTRTIVRGPTAISNRLQ